MTALFSKKTKKEEWEIVPKKDGEVSVSSPFSFVQESVITGFYISEKAGLLNNLNQYIFKVSNNANKSQLAKQIEKMFNVKVRGVKIMNTKNKKRTVGKYSGFKPGFKKAIVVLEKGYVIEQAR